MITIKNTYKFYAGHRNKNADEKCGRIHGHTYYVTCYFNTGAIDGVSGVTLLFGDLDKGVEPIIKEYDHYFLLYEKDTLCEILELANEPFIKLPFETSAENMAVWLFTRIKNETGLPIIQIDLQETTTSTVTYKP